MEFHEEISKQRAKIINKLIGGIKGSKKTTKKDILGDVFTGPKSITGGSYKMSDNINHCKPSSSGMSECDACKLRKSSEKITEQEKCKFFKKATREDRCQFETFKEYCWSTEAQDDAKG